MKKDSERNCQTLRNNLKQIIKNVNAISTRKAENMQCGKSTT